MKRFSQLLVVALCALSIPAARAGELEPLFDFEQPSAEDAWITSGKIRAARVALPKADLPRESGPAGYGVEVTSDGGGGIYTKAGFLPKDLLSAAEIELWIYRSPDEAKLHPTSTLELQFVESEGQARFFRKVEVSHAGWKKIEAPLRWFRWGGDHIPRWNRVDRLGVWLRDAAALRVDGVALERSADKRAALLSASDLIPLAFPDEDPAKVKRLTTDDCLLLTNATAFDLPAYEKQLKQVQAAVLVELPFLSAPADRATLIVFADENQYRAFPPRLASRMNAAALPPTSQGFTIHGIALSSWSEEQGKPRSVFVHEFVHSLLSARADRDNSNEWLHEGLADYFQLRFHPQNLSPIVTAGLASAEERLPLAEIASGKPVPLNRYWQAMTLVELLLTDDKYRGQLKDLFAAIHNSDSTDLGPHLAPIFGVDWDILTADWRAHCERKYAR